MSTDREG